MPGRIYGARVITRPIVDFSVFFISYLSTYEHLCYGAGVRLFNDFLTV